MARLLPLGELYIFSGLQFVMPDRESATAWLNMRRALDNLESPEALENAQRQQCSAFCELFGCDQLTVKPSELNATLGKFQSYLLVERRDPETGLTPAETFKAEFGHDLQVPEMPALLEPMAGASDVTILCDDFDGIVVLPDYNRFRLVFESQDHSSAVPDWRELLWTYINDPDIPIVAFERVAEDFPIQVETVLRELLGDRKFSLEHLYAMLLHYKQPVDGLDDLEDDRQLWDLFNGNVPPNQKQTKSKTKAKKKLAATGRTAAANKKSGSRAGKTRTVSAKKRTTVATKRAKAQPASRSKVKTKPVAGGKANPRRLTAKSARTRKR